MWQKKFEKYGSESFTVVGLALDLEGVGPAKRYYDKYGVTFPSLVDPDYATRFGAVPKTFFVDESGVVRSSKNWERRLATAGPVERVPDDVRKKWSPAGQSFEATSLSNLVAANASDSDDLIVAAQLGSRFIALGLNEQATVVLLRAAKAHDAKSAARVGGRIAGQLAQVHFQLSRSYVGTPGKRVRHATLAYFLNPSIGLGKQIARLISPEKFDERSDGTLDDKFREATLQRLIKERKSWLAE